MGAQGPVLSAAKGPLARGKYTAAEAFHATLGGPFRAKRLVRREMQRLYYFLRYSPRPEKKLISDDVRRMLSACNGCAWSWGMDCVKRAY